MTGQGPQGGFRGRAAGSNRPGRFELHDRQLEDDGWPGDEPGDRPDRLKTVLTVDNARSIISHNDSPDIPFERSINPYRGCEHGCIYCFARPSHGYLGLSSGLDFETRLFYKPEAANLLERALGRSGYRPCTLALGSNTDPYQPCERKLHLTRRCLEVLAACRHPVCVITKSVLVLRDLDILSELARNGLATVCLSITTLDPLLARRLEPRAAAPRRRLEAVRTLSHAGVPVSVLVSPIIPGLTDPEMEAILGAAAKAGATGASYGLLRLPHDLADLFTEWLEANYPDRAARITSRIKAVRGGRMNDGHFARRFTGDGIEARLLADRFRLAKRRLGLDNRRWDLRCDLFRPPSRDGFQPDLFSAADGG